MLSLSNPGSPQSRLHNLSRHVLAPVCTSSQTKQRALEGIRVVELATVIAGPISTCVLGDLGADVIKIEAPDGDALRQQRVPGKSGGPAFEQMNRGKRGVVLDMKHVSGLQAFLGLLEGSDVLVTNVRRKALEALRIDYEQVKARFPRLIYAHVTGWGRSETANTGKVEAENEAGFDIGAFYARSGMAEAFRQGVDAKTHVQWPGAIGDMMTGLGLAQGITTALYERERSGVGQLVETSLLHAGLFAMGLQLVLASVGVEGDSIGWVPTRKTYESRDGVWFQLLGSTNWPVHLDRLLRALGLSHLTPVPETFWYPPHPGADELIGNIRATFKALDSADLISRFAEADVWHTITNTPTMALQDKRALDLNAFFKPIGLKGPEGYKLVRSPTNLSHTTFKTPRRAPHMGEHTHDVLQETLSWDSDKIAEASGHIVAKPSSAQSK